MIAVIVAKSTNGRARLTAERTYVQQLSQCKCSFAALFSLLQLPIASVLVQS